MLGHHILLAKRAASREVVLELPAFRPCAIERGLGSAERQAIEFRIDLEERGSLLDAVTLVNKDLGQKSANLRPDLSLAPCKDTAGCGDSLDD